MLWVSSIAEHFGMLTDQFAQRNSQRSGIFLESKPSLADKSYIRRAPARKERKIVPSPNALAQDRFQEYRRPFYRTYIACHRISRLKVGRHVDTNDLLRCCCNCHPDHRLRNSWSTQIPPDGEALY